MDFMFYNCYSLTNLDISNFDNRDNISTRYMFSGCSDDLENKIRNQSKKI